MVDNNRTATFRVGQETLSFSNTPGRFDDNNNFIDVFPPAGYDMSHLELFMAGIGVIHFGGRVDLNDSLRCQWERRNDRVRACAQNTEQRAKPAINWVAIWSKNDD